MVGDPMTEQEETVLGGIARAWAEQGFADDQSQVVAALRSALIGPLPDDAVVGRSYDIHGNMTTTLANGDVIHGDGAFVNGRLRDLPS